MLATSGVGGVGGVGGSGDGGVPGVSPPPLQAARNNNASAVVFIEPSDLQNSRMLDSVFCHRVTLPHPHRRRHGTVL